MIPDQFFVDNPLFPGQKNGLVTCSICGWDWAGTRSHLKFAWNEHYRMNHSQEAGAAFLRVSKPLESIFLAR